MDESLNSVKWNNFSSIFKMSNRKYVFDDGNWTTWKIGMVYKKMKVSKFMHVSTFI
jgi:hypothetical protein